MKVIIPKEKMEMQYQVGDIFEIEGYDNAWILVDEGAGEYILRGLGDRNWYGLNGSHKSIDKLFIHLNKRAVKILNHYSIDDYELHLVKK